MTRKEKVFRHIEDNGNAMRYTDIIKFAFEDKYGKGTFNKKENRGFYACAFNYYSYYSSFFNKAKKNIGDPKGHFVVPTKNGHLYKLSNKLWSVHRPLGWKRNDTEIPEDSETSTSIIEDDEYRSMCDVLSEYNITSDQLDNLATEYYHKKAGDGESCYHWAYYDLLERAGVISDATKSLQKEIDDLANRADVEHVPPIKEQNYIVIKKADNYSEGIFLPSELQTFFIHRDPKDYMIIEAGNMVTLEKKVVTTTTIIIK